MAEEEGDQDYKPVMATPSGSSLLRTCAVIILALMSFLVIIAALALVSYLTGNNFGGERKTTITSAGKCSILFPSGAGSDEQIGNAINTWIAQKSPNSPLKGKGTVFAKSGRSSGVNPALIAAIALKESSLGIHIPDTTYNPFGRTASGSQPFVEVNGRKWYKFNSWDEAILDEGPYIKRVYIDAGLTTVGGFLNKYAPPSENDTSTYIKQVTDWMNEIVKLASGALGAECIDTAVAGTGGHDTGQCLNSKEIVGPPIKPGANKLAQATLADKLAQLYQINNTWRVTEACPPTASHQDRNHYNGRAVDIAIFPQDKANSNTINKLIQDVKNVGFDDVLDEYHNPTGLATGGHIHLEWHGQ